ncbi:MAG: response regulator [Gemmatimonadales bacterium]
MAARASPSSYSPAWGTATGSTILIADDDAVIRSLCCRTLQQDGATVLEAEDGEAALRLIEDHDDIDLVITDLTMPRLGGHEVAEVLSVFRPGLPVLAMSGTAHKMEPDRRLPVLAKPFSAAALIAVTREMRLRAREVRIWADEKRAQARELYQIAAAMQKTNPGPPEKIDLVAVGRELMKRGHPNLTRAAARPPLRSRAPSPTISGPGS